MNRLYFGDNLEVLQSSIPDNSVDLIYLDPPFNSKAQYNAIFKTHAGRAAQSQAEAFMDTWAWGAEAARAYDVVLGSGSGASRILKALRDCLGESDLMAYLAMMAARLADLHRVLKPNGSLYLHCDQNAGHYLKVMLDGVFGPRAFKSEITWKRSSSHGNVARNYGSLTDSIYFYAKGERHTWNQQFAPLSQTYVARKFGNRDQDGRQWQSVSLRNPSVRPNLQFPFTASNEVTYFPHPNGWAVGRERLEAYDRDGRLHFPSREGGQLRLKQYLDERPGTKLQNLWDDIPAINSQAQERLGYPTQKPLALLERIIRASSNEGDVVLDPFCGCGTTIHAAQSLNRKWLGIDVTHYAISVIEDRLKRHFPDAKFEVEGRPRDLDDAYALAARNKYQFQWWANWMLGAQAYKQKKGPDGGIDGLIYFHNGAGRTGTVVISVKGGLNLGPEMVRSLGHVVERENAELGVLVTLGDPTPGMIREAASSPLIGTPLVRRQKLQIVTAKELIEGSGTLDLPEPIHVTHGGAPRRRARAVARDLRQLSLPLVVHGGLKGTDVTDERVFLDPRVRAEG
ncbi:restriction endonuclease [Novosphingobium flavum]|uniref:site-specific DNA-methyltransferase (adenine-specific) n=1 Tax=Novosphingobium flavum TaxID=1778672 RepID=A0A7X1FP00_9SPHN|nr:DNA methyltransferase [Novosphingobium flavum]MBC2664311.1 restriction endonuclease [Novosphingobium flavum]